MSLDNKKFALLISGASAGVYAACSVFVALFPGLSNNLMMSLFHVPGNLFSGIRITLGGAFVGLVEVAIYTYIVGWIFAWVFNKSLQK